MEADDLPVNVVGEGVRTKVRTREQNDDAEITPLMHNLDSDPAHVHVDVPPMGRRTIYRRLPKPVTHGKAKHAQGMYSISLLRPNNQRFVPKTR